ncbi:MAG: hypothetical protein E5W81_02685 [Mesorhizobium sp.]|nr:MAG: hypothetical protein E5W70_03025 [Mesorhizobium sp.]TIX41935.1 MAG: hypothetical protein E5V36_14680 [Mesorhizobium sp.]TKB31850.1 MAG: hypothetical protein E5W69_01035 [Mesorhizobium sp.]TKB98510.1 MAG: hypothetical protein E5W81_02685 [Mesorhizobium sp.]
MATIFPFARDSLTNLVSRMGAGQGVEQSRYYGVPLLNHPATAQRVPGSLVAAKLCCLPAPNTPPRYTKWYRVSKTSAKA